ncbi:hypothetical protein [Breznakiella homolactica]|uniref:Uncharacterized protein n=1 Tax=Breznakiella homolactica TaxID=2798577 RepID=A0A7T7XLS8_9SPIR|nr:hypothetical protein [Breznakiella homolactica]QQO08651.1 hypothetical protein JFL75_17235 [Breznakiella homolactica]
MFQNYIPTFFILEADMWFLKSPRNAQPVDAQTFFYETWQQDPYKLIPLIVLHEKLSYCLQLDNAFTLICHYHALSWVKTLTMGNEEYELLDSVAFPSPMEQVVQYYHHEADTIDGHSMKYFNPDLSVKSFIDSTMRRFAKTDGKERALLQKEIAGEIWETQNAVCHTVFAEIDKYDTQGFLNIFKVVHGVIVNKNYMLRCLEEAQREYPEYDLLPEVYKLCSQIDRKVDEVKESISNVFYELSQLYNTIPNKIRQQDFHWRKLYMFAKYPDMFDVVEALQHLEGSSGRPYITDNGNSFGWNDTYGVLAGLIRERINPSLSGKRDWEPFMLAFNKDTLWDDARKELSDKAIVKIKKINRAIDDYLQMA